MVETLLLKDLEQQKLVIVGRGKVISKTAMTEKPGNYPVYSSSAQGDGVFGRYGEYMFDDERITWSVDGGGRLFYRPAHRYSVTNVSGWIKVNTDKLLTKYLYYCLTAQWARRKFDYTYKAHPSVIREIYQIKMVDIEKQERIVRSLEKIEKIIAAKSEQLEILDNLIKARFVEMFGNEPAEIELSKLGSISTGSTPSMKVAEYYEHNELPFYKPGDFIDGVSNIFGASSYVDSRAEKVSRIMEPGAVAVTCIGIIGKIGIIQKRSICNQQINFIKPNSDVSSIYLAYAIATKKQYMQDKANAPVVPILNKTNFSKVTIPFVAFEKQKQFEAFVSQVDKSKFALTSMFSMLEKLRLHLMI